MANKKRQYWGACVILAGLAVAAQAGVEYAPDKNIIWVAGYPSNYPCTLEYIQRIDRINGWGKVDYDEAADVYTIRSHLYIGADNCWDTHFQIGDNTHPRVTVVMHGNIIVHPDVPRFASDTAYKTFVPKTTPGVNVLRSGDPVNTSITPAIQFAPGYGLALGFGDRRWPFAGELHLYNSAITAMPGETGRVVGINGWLRLQGRTIRLVNSRVANVRQGVHGVMGSGWDHQVRGMTFENMGIGLRGYWDNRGMRKPLEDCRFLRCGIALDRPGALVALKNCVFEQNDRNWNITTQVSSELFFENCMVDGQRIDGKLP